MSKGSLGIARLVSSVSRMTVITAFQLSSAPSGGWGFCS